MLAMLWLIYVVIISEELNVLLLALFLCLFFSPLMQCSAGTAVHRQFTSHYTNNNF